jgi:SAM-dependent methyltransferase
MNMNSAAKNIEYQTSAIVNYYRQHRVRWDQFYESERVVLSQLGIGAHSTVLDIGCGCGGLGLALRERFAVSSYTGVEINRQAADAARELNPAGRFLCADILGVSSQEVPEAAFDLVVSLSCIDWNLQFAEMLARAYRFVKPGGHFLASFRLTPAASLRDMATSYQYINFEGKREGEVAPYVVLNVGALMQELLALQPARLRGFGYWGAPSPTAVTPLTRVGFAVIALQKSTSTEQVVLMELQLPTDLLQAAFRG